MKKRLMIIAALSFSSSLFAAGPRDSNFKPTQKEAAETSAAQPKASENGSVMSYGNDYNVNPYEEREVLADLQVSKSRAEMSLQNHEDKVFEKSGVLKPLNKSSSLNDIKSSVMSVEGAKKSKGDAVSFARTKILSETAASFGARMGLAQRSYEINYELALKASELDTLFDFRKLTIEEGVLPPVLTEGENAYKQSSSDEVRAAGKVYKIEFPARFSSVAPTWRTYLIQSATEPEVPHPSLRPKNEKEGEIWDAWVVRGWENGSSQANSNFTSSLGRLKRDYVGMIRYKQLYAQGMVSKPIVARTNLGVTGSESEMFVDDQIYRITEKARLNPNPKQWVFDNDEESPLNKLNKN